MITRRRHLATLVLGACLTHAAFALTPSQQLADIARRAYDAQARFDPLTATWNGDPRFNDQLNLSLAPAERARRLADVRGFLKQLDALPPLQLQPADRLNRQLLVHNLRGELALAPYPSHLLPLEQMSSVPLVLAMLAGGQVEQQPLRTASDFDAYLKRLAVLPAWCDQAIANLREGVARGIVQSPAVMQATAPQVARLADADLDRNPFGAVLRLLAPGATPGLSATDATRLADAYRRELTDRALPALQRLQAYVQAEYLPAVAKRSADGRGSLPGGQAWYRQLVRDQTGTRLTPDEIHRLGLQEVARIQGEIVKLAPKLGFTGDPLKDGGLLAWLDAQPQLRPFKTDAEVLEAYRALNARIEPQLPRLFGRLPKAPLDIREEPELTRATASPHYTVARDEAGARGVFWAVIPDPAKLSTPGMTALFLHEGQPGHHFQVALQFEMSLPDFRRYGGGNAFIEGWALYAETLGHELGLYDDPIAYAGALQAEIFRAARLVVDTGLHAKGWSRAQAIRYLHDATGFSEAGAANQIDRYLAWPGQALGYKVGSLKIQALRQRAQARLGGKFSLAAFHDQVLGEGALPLDVLERRIDAWIAASAR